MRCRAGTGARRAANRLRRTLYLQPVPTGYKRDRGRVGEQLGAVRAHMNVAVALAADKLPGVGVDLDRVVPSADDASVRSWIGVDRMKSCRGLDVAADPVRHPPRGRGSGAARGRGRSPVRAGLGRTRVPVRTPHGRPARRTTCFSAAVTRRAFLRSGALALVSFGLDPLFVARAPRSRRRSGSTTTHAAACWSACSSAERWMALSMVVPHGDAASTTASGPRIDDSRGRRSWIWTATSGLHSAPWRA